jgi:hypothetical protein
MESGGSYYFRCGDVHSLWRHIYSIRFGDGGSLRRRRRVVGVAKHTGVGGPESCCALTLLVTT